MSADGLQGFGLIDLWNQKISCPVLHECLVAFLVLEDFNAFIEDLDLVVGIKMVIHHHPPTAADQGPAQFYGRQPVQVEVSKHTALDFTMT